MKIAITGASGMIGSALVPHLRARGHEVVRLVRRTPPQSADEAQWDPRDGVVDRDRLAGVAAAVHLAGAGVGRRPWTAAAVLGGLSSEVLGSIRVEPRRLRDAGFDFRHPDLDSIVQTVARRRPT